MTITQAIFIIVISTLIGGAVGGAFGLAVWGYEPAASAFISNIPSNQPQRLYR